MCWVVEGLIHYFPTLERPKVTEVSKEMSWNKKMKLDRKIELMEVLNNKRKKLANNYKSGKNTLQGKDMPSSSEEN